MAASRVTIGSLCSGVGGLDLAAHLLFGDVRLVWTAETDPAAARVLAARWPGVPNLGDIRGGLDAPTVDVVTAGFPCQPVSQAGRRRGAADPRWLWPDVAATIDNVRPRLVLLENVPGLVSSGLLEVVVADLEGCGYRVSWTMLAASDVGACHRRRRVFIAATIGDPPEPVDGAGVPMPDDTGRLLPTPTAKDSDRGPDLARFDRPRSGGPDLVTVVERLLPTPTAANARNSRNHPSTSLEDPPPGRTLCDVSQKELWGDYVDAINRHMAAVGRPAPSPDGEHRRLNPQFVEWMMMLPDGWVCDVDGLRRSAMLRLLGNAVVPIQAAAAYRRLLTNPTLPYTSAQP